MVPNKEKTVIFVSAWDCMGCLQNKYGDTKLTDMEILALKDKHVLPTPEVLNSVLHDSYRLLKNGIMYSPDWI